MFRWVKRFFIYGKKSGRLDRQPMNPDAKFGPLTGRFG
jgi:hypothetical protein